MSGRFKLEIVHTVSNEDTGVKKTRTTLVGWYDSREELNKSVTFMRGCPLNDGVVNFRVSEYGDTPRVEMVPWNVSSN